MTIEDFEKRLNATPLAKPNPRWREEILTSCSPPRLHRWTKVGGIAAMLALAGLSVHLWNNYREFKKLQPVVRHTDTPAGKSIIPGFKIASSNNAVWDRILLKESAEVPSHQTPTNEVIEFLVEHQQVMDRFATAVQLRGLTLPDPLPITRMRQTCEAFLWRAYTSFDPGNSRKAVDACLATFPLIHLLGESPNVEAAIAQAGLTGITIFSIGTGIDLATTDDELRVMQEALEKMYPLQKTVRAFERWLANAASLPKANRYLQLWVDAWDADANGFRLENCPGYLLEPVNDETKGYSYRNVMADTAALEYRMKHVLIALIVERYRRLHGEVPDQLEELIPDFADHLPNSPWTGKPYDYEKIAADNARMSSPNPLGDERSELLLRGVNKE